MATCVYRAVTTAKQSIVCDDLSWNTLRICSAALSHVGINLQHKDDALDSRASEKILKVHKCHLKCFLLI